MFRKIVMGIVIAFALGVAGCRSCLSPYEHCQPTFIPERGDQCMGELYRCGSVLGGMERESSATGDCKECGGGNVEYYTANGYQKDAIDANPTDENVEPQYAESAASLDVSPYAQTSYNASPSTNPRRATTFADDDFSLRDDSAEYAVYE